jgi:hypothetical protein
MKMNSWSIVKSPKGLSLRNVQNGKISYCGEVCVAVVDGVLSVRVHVDGLDTPISSMEIPTQMLEPQ